MDTPLQTAADGSVLGPGYSPYGSPSAWYFNNSDALRIRSFSGQGITLVVEGRFLSPDGDVSPFRRDHLTNSDHTSATTTFSMGAGWLLNAQVRVPQGSIRRGTTFVIVEVVRGLNGSQESLGTLLQDYVTSSGRLAWPGSPIVPSSAGPGFLSSIVGTDPAANTEISETVTTGTRRRVLSFIATLVTDVNAANRDVALTLDDGVNVIGRFPAGQNQAASLTTRYVWTSGGARFTIASDRTIVIPIPDLWLPEAYRLRTVTTALQVGDNWSAPVQFFEELVEV